MKEAKGKKNMKEAKGKTNVNVAPTPEGQEPLIAVIRVRGNLRVSEKINDTLGMLNVYRVNYCSVHKATPSIMGMIKKVKDTVTWGEIDEATLKRLIEEKGEPNPDDKKKTKSFFRLNAPLKGYGRKGIKRPFKIGGALGYRGAKINEIIHRMIH